PSPSPFPNPTAITKGGGCQGQTRSPSSPLPLPLTPSCARRASGLGPEGLQHVRTSKSGNGNDCTLSIYNLPNDLPAESFKDLSEDIPVTKSSLLLAVAG